MALNSEILRQRLREAFGFDSQDTIGKKLNMTQGNISKMLSGPQQPTLETIYQVAQVYNVSIDWLLGLSESKHVSQSSESNTYYSVVEAGVALHMQGADIDTEKGTFEIAISTGDPLLRMLLLRAVALVDADPEIYKKWRDERLVVFSDKGLIHKEIWREGHLWFDIETASSEADWVSICERIEREEEQFRNAFGP